MQNETGKNSGTPSALRTVLIVTALTLLCAGLIAGGYFKASDNVYLNLKQNEVILDLNEPFEPMKYVESYSMDADHLRLPADIDTSVPGTKAAVYALTAGNEEIVRILRVTVRQNNTES